MKHKSIEKTIHPEVKPSLIDWQQYTSQYTTGRKTLYNMTKEEIINEFNKRFNEAKR